MIVVTGGLGFIGANIADGLSRGGHVVKILDIKTLSLEDINKWLLENHKSVDFIFHMGAISDTMETDDELFNKYNIKHSIFLWNYCVTYNIPFVYTSSAATYGDGSMGFDDNIIFGLNPLNKYGHSKQTFDEYVVTANLTPPFWAGLKFFNVYGYNESHKGNMASVMYHFYHQIKHSGRVNLFKSYKEGVLDGEQKRDFIFVDDITDVCLNLIDKKIKPGIYNIGTGIARTYNDVVKSIFSVLMLEEKITYIDIPERLINKYQYHTEAKILKIQNEGLLLNPTTLEDGIKKYIHKWE